MTYTKKAMQRQQFAAVLEDGDPGASHAARVVPKGARVVKIGKAVAGYVATPARISRQIGLLDLRIVEIERLIVSRFGKLRIDTDDAALVAEIIAAHAEPNRAALWIAKACPGVDPDAAIAAGADRRWTAARLGKALNLTLVERITLGIRTFRANCSPAEARKAMADRRKSRDRDRKAAARKAEGKMNREEFLADSVAAQAKAQGVSRSTVYRRRNRLFRKSSNKEYGGNNLLHMPVPGWLSRAFAGPCISVNDPSIPPEALRIGAIVTAALKSQPAMRLH